jgi:inorganic pyrophosphatase
MEIGVVIEDPRGSTVRHHWDAESRRWVIKRHPKSMDPWPANYGFVPGTFNPADGDDLDILVLSVDKLQTGAKVNARVVGVLQRPDGDDKILSVLVGDPHFGSITGLSEVPAGEIRAIENWFAAWSEVGEWGDVETAIVRVNRGRQDARELKHIPEG